jgi:hypothetical protein
MGLSAGKGGMEDTVATAETTGTEGEGRRERWPAGSVVETRGLMLAYLRADTFSGVYCVVVVFVV